MESAIYGWRLRILPAIAHATRGTCAAPHLTDALYEIVSSNAHALTCERRR
jgi:hypothetical protein